MGEKEFDDYGHTAMANIPVINGLKARIAALEAAVRRHRSNVWGSGPVEHPEDVELYRVLP